MMTFFTILFILLGINAVMMVLSLKGVDHKSNKQADLTSTESTAKVYPLDLISSKYKKAV